MSQSAGNSVIDRITGTSVCGAGSLERCTSTPRIPTRRAPSMSCGRLSPTITDSLGLHAGQRQRRLEDAGVRLHVAVLGRGDRGGDQPLELEVLLKRRQRAVRVRDQPDLQAACRQLTQHRRARRRRGRSAGTPPTRRRSRARSRRPRPGAAHLLDDAAGVAHEDLRVVDVLLLHRPGSTTRRARRASNRDGIDVECRAARRSARSPRPETSGPDRSA